MKQAKAAVLYKLNSPLVMEDIAIPDPAVGQVLVKVVASGICHTQLLEIQGKRGEDKFLPHCLGHEGAGIVEAVGEGVTRVRVGDHVILSWIKAEGVNAASSIYFAGTKKINAGPVTTFLNYTLASENRVVPIRKDMPLDKAALIGCSFATGAGAVLNTANVQPDSTIIIFGVGGVGLSAIQGAVLARTRLTIAVDISDQNLKRAEGFGATHIMNPERDNVSELVKELTDGKGVDYAIEAAGRKETMEQAYEVIRLNGGMAILVGNLSFQKKISIDPFHLICGKRLVGSWGGSTVPERDFQKYIDLYMNGILKLDNLITHRTALTNVDQVFELMKKGEVGRAIIEF